MLTREHSAAQYVRMSTDLQQYSIEYQAEVIGLYAMQHGLTIVRSYEDSGRSGVRLDGRPALQSLLADVCSGHAEFQTILVYDVSRWGRFQDSDESAHYEYLCRKAGVGVVYCAEQFANDGSITAAVLKNIKRAMAGEFSRELSVKVFAGQRRLASKGYHIGGSAGFGLRRVLLDEEGKPISELKFGQWKAIQSQHVILTPGPIKEIKTIHRIYDMFLDQKMGLRDIAARLNAKGIPAERGTSWSWLKVRSVLSSERYIGNAIYNRTSTKLNGRWRRNPGSEWIRRDGAFKAVVTQERFENARRQLIENVRRPSRNEMLDLLTALWCQKGRLTLTIIDAAEHAPCGRSYASQFGSLAKAYRMIGYRGADSKFRSGDMRMELVQDITARIVGQGGSVETFSFNRNLLINGQFTLSVCISRIRTQRLRFWQFGYRSEMKPDIIVGARVAERGGPITDYYLLPFMFMPHGSWITTSMSSGTRLDLFRCKTLEPLYALCRRTPVETPRW